MATSHDPTAAARAAGLRYSLDDVPVYSAGETKFSRMSAFGRALPALRERVSHDLGVPALPREKTLATVVRLLDELLIRVGNDVNDYLRQISGEEFTAKDFRTWAGTVLAARFLRDRGAAEEGAVRRANVVAAVDAVATRLSNTRAVCRSSYIHPAILSGYEEGSLCQFTGKAGDPALDADEQWTLAYLGVSGVG